MKKHAALIFAFTVCAAAQEEAPLIERCRGLAAGDVVRDVVPDPGAGGGADTVATREAIEDCLSYLNDVQKLREQYGATDRLPAPGGESAAARNDEEHGDLVSSINLLNAKLNDALDQMEDMETRVIDLELSQPKEQLYPIENIGAAETSPPPPPPPPDNDGVLGVMRAGGGVIYLARLGGEVVRVTPGQAHGGRLFNVIDGVAFWGDKRLDRAKPEQGAGAGAESAPF